MVKLFPLIARTGLLASALCLGGLTALAQETLPWSKRNSDQGYSERSNGYQPRSTYDSRYPAAKPYQQAQSARAAPDPYRSGPPPVSRYDYGQPESPPRVYSDQAPSPAYPPRDRAAPRREADYNARQPRYVKPYRPPAQPAYPRRYGSNEPYSPNYGDNGPRYDDPRYDDPRYDRAPRIPNAGRASYSENEVVDAGHRFFGTLSTGLAKAIQWAFKKSGRPNGYILGEDAGGAFIAGLRYGEGKLYTKNYGVRRVFWQGPSVGYDFGGDGNRTMTLVYNLRSPNGIYRRFGGVQGAAYLVGGVSVQFLRGGRDMTLAPIRTGVGVRLGANIGYLKYTRRPTWNPF